jgi:hypothetical protein
MNLTLPLFLTLLSGVCWTVVYIDSIRLGFKDHTYAMPFWALALNIAWEFLHSVLGYKMAGWDIQVVINAIWFVLDCVIIYTYFLYGRKYFPKIISTRWFLVWSLLVLVAAYVLQSFFVLEFGEIKGGGYAAFLQNLLMSVLYINMLIQRGSSEGQSLLLAVSKWIGTLAPTIMWGVLGGVGFNGPSPLILAVGIFCSIFDLIYVFMLLNAKARERNARLGTGGI